MSFLSQVRLVVVLLLKFFISVMVFVIALPFAVLARLVHESKKVKKILIAGIETSANIQEISSTLSTSSAYQVHVAQFEEHPFYPPLENDKIKIFHQLTIWANDSAGVSILKNLRRILFLFRAMFAYDIVFFNWNRSFLFFNLDYLIFVLANKILIVRQCGDEVRYRPLQHGIHSQFGIDQWQNGQRSFFDMMYKLRCQIMAESFAIVISTKDHATFQYKDLFVRPYIQKQLTRTTGLNKEVPLIIHAPSDTRIKGTALVNKVMESLKVQGYSFKFELLTGLKNAVILEKLSEAAIVVDQPGAVPARFAVEAMASGCAVVGGNIIEINGLEGCPVIPFLPKEDNLENTIKKLLEDPGLRVIKGDENFQYWKKNFSPEAFLIYFESLLIKKAKRFSKFENQFELLYGAAEKWYEKAVLKIIYQNR